MKDSYQQQLFASPADATYQLLAGPLPDACPPLVYDSYDEGFFCSQESNSPPWSISSKEISHGHAGLSQAAHVPDLLFTSSTPAVTAYTSPLRIPSRGDQDISGARPRARPGTCVSKPGTACLGLSAATLRSLQTSNLAHHCILNTRSRAAKSSQSQQATRKMGDALHICEKAMGAVSQIIECPSCCIRTQPAVSLAVTVICDKLIAWNQAILAGISARTSAAQTEAEDTGKGRVEDRSRHDQDMVGIESMGGQQQQSYPHESVSRQRLHSPFGHRASLPPRQAVEMVVETEELRIGQYTVPEDGGLADLTRATAVGGQLHQLEETVRRLTQTLAPTATFDCDKDLGGGAHGEGSAAGGDHARELGTPAHGILVGSIWDRLQALIAMTAARTR